MNKKSASSLPTLPVDTAAAASAPRFARQRIAAALLAFGLLPSTTVSALGVGQADLRSHLGQPLDVRVPILLDGSEPPGELQARLLPAEAYTALGLEPPRLDPGALVLELVSADGGVRLALRSNRRVNEPLIVLLLETRLGSVRIVHELTLMLEPSAVAAEAPEAVLPTARLSLPAPILDEAPVRVPLSGERPTPEPAPKPAADTRRYGPVASGETLRQIAERVRPEPKYGIRRVMTALLLANPEAFDAGRRPQAGAELIVPSRRQMLDLSAETITATVGPRAGAGAAATTPPATLAPERTPEVAPEPRREPDPAVVVSTPSIARDSHAGLRLSLRLSPASAAAIAAALDASAQLPEAADAAVDAVEAADPASSVQSVEEIAAPAPNAEPAVSDAPVVETSARSAAAEPAAGSPVVWWLIALLSLIGLAGAGWRWRRGRGSVPPPAAPASAAVTEPLPAAAPDAPSPQVRPVRMRVVGGRKPPEVVALQGRIARLASRPGVSQRILTLASAYIDSGNTDMATRLLDELEAPPRRGSA